MSAQPLWQMDVRHRLGLDPTKTADPISRLLFAALYAAKSEDEFHAAITNHIEELQRALKLLTP